MSKFIQVAVVGLFLFCGRALFGHLPEEPGHIDTKVLATLVSSKVPLVILDARGAAWDDGKRIATAQSLSHRATAEQAEALIPSKDALIVVYCTGIHCPASGWLAARLAELGYPNVLEYAEGIEAWVGAELPVRTIR